MWINGIFDLTKRIRIPQYSSFLTLRFTYYACCLYLIDFGVFANELEEPLGKDEGFVVIPILINGAVPNAIKLEGEGVFSSSYVAKELDYGFNFRVVRLPVGKYKWDRINFTSQRYFKLEEHSFNLQVHPGAINYGGHFIVDINYQFSTAKYRYVNRSSRIIDELERNFGNLIENYSLLFSGNSEDPFIEFYKQIENR